MLSHGYLLQIFNNVSFKYILICITNIKVVDSNAFLSVEISQTSYMCFAAEVFSCDFGSWDKHF